MKVLFMANIPSPYRVDFFNELGKYCDLTVTFEGKTATDRDEKWKAAESQNFKAIFMNGIRTKSDQFLCVEIIKIIKTGFDHIILGGYSTPTAMLAIEYMRIKHIPFWMEADGGLISNDNRLKYKIKRHFISAASGWFSSGKMTTEYLTHYGADKSKVHVYPFTSLKAADILPAVPNSEEKMRLRKKLGMGGKVILTVGRFSYMKGYGKGFDVLMNAMTSCPKDCSLYIVGDEPTPEFVDLKKKLKLDNVFFVGFKTKEELKDYYMAADIFCLQTRGDVWGLVVNEAMACGLPVITTNKCVAGLELIQDESDGYVVDAEDCHAVADRITYLVSQPLLLQNMSHQALETIREYTIEKMASAHEKILANSGRNTA